jgi:hypothetical protein
MESAPRGRSELGVINAVEKRGAGNATFRRGQMGTWRGRSDYSQSESWIVPIDGRIGPIEKAAGA